jgi:hypothetical protein
MGTFAIAPHRTARDSFDVKPLASNLIREFWAIILSKVNSMMTGLTFSNDTQYCFGCSHLAYLAVMVILVTCSPSPGRWLYLHQ